MDQLWVGQAVGSLVLAFLFGYEAWRAYQFDSHHPDDPIGEAAITIAAGLAFIAAGNAMTSWASAFTPAWSELRDFGGTGVRGTLFVLAVYLIVRHPLREHRRHAGLPEPPKRTRKKSPPTP